MELYYRIVSNFPHPIRWSCYFSISWFDPIQSKFIGRSNHSNIVSIPPLIDTIWSDRIFVSLMPISGKNRIFFQNTSECGRDYDECGSNCPCNTNCINGCPCQNWCVAKPISFLVLNSFYSPEVKYFLKKILRKNFKGYQFG